jgi:hypothetical protein
MWCVPNLTDEFKERMESVLDIYAKPYDPNEPVICMDEKSKQLIADTRNVTETQEGKERRRDYEYQRNGTKNIFVSVEPKAGYRKVSVTDKRKKVDFAHEVDRLLSLKRYRNATVIHLVLDNLNTHNGTSLFEAFSKKKAERMLEKIQFHYTPKHASWLNMAEIEIGILDRQCIKGRIASEEVLKRKVAFWQRARNKSKMKINWKFTTKDAMVKFKYSRELS